MACRYQKVSNPGPYKPICRDCAVYFSITVTGFVFKISRGGSQWPHLTHKASVQRPKFLGPTQDGRSEPIVINGVK